MHCGICIVHLVNHHHILKLSVKCGLVCMVFVSYENFIFIYNIHVHFFQALFFGGGWLFFLKILYKNYEVCSLFVTENRHLLSIRQQNFFLYLLHFRTVGLSIIVEFVHLIGFCIVESLIFWGVKFCVFVNTCTFIST